MPSGDGKKDKKAEKAKKEKADDPKAGADVGKIVNLMAGDANRVSCFFYVINLLSITLLSLRLP